MSLNNLRIASVLLLASLAFLPAAAITTPVVASDDDVICFDYPLPGGGEETECGTVGDYKAECKLTDPDSESEFCQDINSRALWRASWFADDDSGQSAQLIKLPPKPNARR
jgi:hypothetical protein